MKNSIKTNLLVFGIFLIIGCAASPELMNMIPKDETLVFESTGKSIKIGNATGGNETNPMGYSKINSRDFRLALIESLRKSNLFAKLISEGDADYHLTTELVTQDQPAFGLNLTVTLKVIYILTNTLTGEKLFDKLIASSYTAGMGEAFVASTRLTKANEGAVRENIKLFIKDLSQLQL